MSMLVPLYLFTYLVQKAASQDNIFYAQSEEAALRYGLSYEAF